MLQLSSCDKPVDGILSSMTPHKPVKTNALLSEGLKSLLFLVVHVSEMIFGI